MNKKRLIITLITIVAVICVLVGSIAYYRMTISGSIKGSTGNAVFNVTGFTNESTKEITLKEGLLVPGDKGSFTLSLDATGSNVDMYVTLSIDKGTLPTNLKFYTTSDYKSELHKYYEFMDTSNQSKDITIYWYWNPYISNEEDSKFINKTNLTATVNVNAVQISEYAMMKNGNNVTFEYDKPTFDGTEFWSDTYRNNIRTIKFINDLSNLPAICNEDNLCFDVTETGSNKKVYAYLIDSGTQGVVGQEDNSDTKIYENLYNLYIVSEVPIFAPIDCSYMFYSFINLVTIDFNNNFNTSLTTNMEGMFMGGGYYYIREGGAAPVSYIPNDKNKVELLDNIDNVKPSLMSEKVFEGQTNLKELDLSSFNTSNVTDMSYMFANCWLLTSIDLSSFNTSNVTNMSCMFYDCEDLTSIDLSSFNTSNVTNMYEMFGGCRFLTSLDISNFNTSNVTNMSRMFSGCFNLTSIELSSFNTSNVSDMKWMFSDCSSLTSLDLSNFNTSNVTDMYGMFKRCSSLTSLDVSSFNTSSVTDMKYMFRDCSLLTFLDLSNFNTSKVTDMGNMFERCSSLTTTINIMNSSIGYYDMFSGAATEAGAQITVNYIADASTLVDNMIATGSGNVVKGVQI